MPFPVPLLPFVTLSHESCDVAVHFTFAATVTVWPATPVPVDPRLADDSPSSSSGTGFPSWFTVNVTVFPPPVTTIDPVRSVDSSFSSTPYTMVPEPLPSSVTRSIHPSSVSASQHTFASTPSSLFAAASYENVRDMLARASVPASSALTRLFCVILWIFLLLPFLTVILACRFSPEVFSFIVYMTFPFPFPDFPFVMTTHFAFDFAVHFFLLPDFTFSSLPWCLAALKVRFFGEILNVFAACRTAKVADSPPLMTVISPSRASPSFSSTL